MSIFKNIFQNLGFTININFKRLVEVRREKMIRDGLNVNCINWELYAKVLEAKHQRMLKDA
jgi:hypothetical protein